MNAPGLPGNSFERVGLVAYRFYKLFFRKIDYVLKEFFLIKKKKIDYVLKEKKVCKSIIYSLVWGKFEFKWMQVFDWSLISDVFIMKLETTTSPWLNLGLNICILFLFVNFFLGSQMVVWLKLLDYLDCV